MTFQSKADIRRRVKANIERSKFARLTHGRPGIYRSHNRPRDDDWWRNLARPRDFLPDIRLALRIGDCTRAAVDLLWLERAVVQKVAREGRNVGTKDKLILRGLKQKLKACKRASR